MNQLEHQNILFDTIKEVLEKARSQAYRAINSVMVQSYWEVGRLIVENEQKGECRAEYGAAVITELSVRLNAEFGAGFSEQSLRNMRQFYQLYPNLSAVWSESGSIRSTMWSKLTWSHIKVILRIEKPEAREYYLNETIESNWSVRALERQVHAFYYERLLSSRDKQPVIQEMKEKTKSLIPKPPIFLSILFFTTSN